MNEPSTCAVCGAAIVVKHPQQFLCKSVECRRRANAIRWARAAAASDVSLVKYSMRPGAAKRILEQHIAGVHNPAAFTDDAARARSRPTRRPKRLLTDAARLKRRADDGRIIYRLGDEKIVGETCSFCGTAYEWDGKKNGTCGQLKCQAARRAKFAKEWYEKNATEHKKNVAARRKQRSAESDAWAVSPPKWDGHLPGFALPISIIPRVERAELLGPALHAIVTRLIRNDKGHDRTRAEWSLMFVGREHTQSGWALYLPSESDASALRETTHEVALRTDKTKLSFGAQWRFRPPIVDATGRSRVRVTAITPVCIRSGQKTGGSRYQWRPKTPSLWDALKSVAARIGLTVQPENIGVLRVSHQTEVVRVRLNQARDLVATCWSGEVVCDVNPLARWLLEVAARIGFGGRNAYGLGRIAVRENPLPDDPPMPILEPWEAVVDKCAERVAERQQCDKDSAREQIMALLSNATVERSTSFGADVRRVGDIRLVTIPTAFGMRRVVDVVFDEKPTIAEELLSYAA